MKYIKATLIFKIPKDKLSPKEQAEWPTSFKELQTEIAETSPEGVEATLKVEEVEE